jgi:hypothetical protein
MSRFTVIIALLGLSFQNSADAQRSTSATSLTRALSTFAAADQNHDGKLSEQEVVAIPIDRKEFLAQDEDKDGSWSRDEFLVFYRQRLLLAGQTVGADLEAETARIQALRKTKAAEEARKKSADAAALPAPQAALGVQAAPQTVAPIAGAVAPVAAATAPSDAAIEAGLEAALEKLEKRAAAGHATREDFQLVRDQLVARARAAANANRPADTVDATGSEAYRKMLQSLDRLEKRAAEGAYLREDYQEFRDMIIHRARLIAKADAPAGPAAPAGDLAAIETGLQNALDELEKRAAEAHATREDFQKVRNQMIARARAAANAGTAADSVGAEGSETYRKMMQSLDRLEKAAAEGVYSREEYRDLRAMFVRRARHIEQGAEPIGSAPAQSRAKATPTAITADPPAPVHVERTAGATEPVREPAPQPASRQQPAPANGDTRDGSKPARPAPPPPDNRPKPDNTGDAQRPPHVR